MKLKNYLDNSAPEVLDAKGAALFLRISERTLRENVERLDIPHRKVGRALIFSRRLLLDWLEEPYYTKNDLDFVKSY